MKGGEEGIDNEERGKDGGRGIVETAPASRRNGGWREGFASVDPIVVAAVVVGSGFFFLSAFRDGRGSRTMERASVAY